MDDSKKTDWHLDWQLVPIQRVGAFTRLVQLLMEENKRVVQLESVRPSKQFILITVDPPASRTRAPRFGIGYILEDQTKDPTTGEWK